MLDPFRRSREEVRSARHLLTANFNAQAVSRAYYACFYAAETALLSLGISRSKHSGVLSAFGRDVVRDGGAPVALGRTLHTLFDLRNRVDYEDVTVTDDQAAALVDEAASFVDGVGMWLARQDG